MKDIRAKALGIDGIDVTTRFGATTAIETINNAISAVSSQRSMLGAVQNRLEHTIRNLETTAENLQAAESRIRDADMIREMMEFTKYTILQQAAQAMLAQANMNQKSMLRLLEAI
jgi:flagellin